MLTGGYLFSHGGVRPGFERMAMDLGTRAMDFWSRYEKEGRVRRVGPFYLAPGGGSYDDMMVFTLYLGDLKELHAIITSEAYERIVTVALQATVNVKSRLFGGGNVDEIARYNAIVMSEWHNAGLIGGDRAQAPPQAP